MRCLPMAPWLPFAMNGDTGTSRWRGSWRPNQIDLPVAPVYQRRRVGRKGSAAEIMRFGNGRAQRKERINDTAPAGSWRRELPHPPQFPYLHYLLMCELLPSDEQVF